MTQKANKQKSTTSAVEEAIAHLWWCRESGLEFQEYNLSRTGRKKIEELAQARRISPSDARWYMRFVDDYSVSDLKAVCATCRKNNFVLSFTHFRVFLCVKDKAIRAELQTRTIEEGLGTVRTRQLKDRLVSKPTLNAGRPTQLLKLEESEVEWIINRDVARLCRNLSQVLTHRHEFQPDFLERLQKLSDRLQQE